MVEIIPAIMPKSFVELREYASELVGLAPIAQIDVMDGVFVPETSWPYGDNNYEAFERIAAEEDEMPQWTEIDFEADLMIARPEQEIEKWIKAGARRIVVHIESVSNMDTVLSLVRDYTRAEEEVDGFFAPTEIGIALNPDTPNQALEPWIGRADFVQFMGIARIGYQGEPFDERVLEKIRDFRGKYEGATISVDGGVNAETAPKLIEAGANRLVSGSAIWKHPSGDIEEAIEDLRQAAELG